MKKRAVGSIALLLFASAAFGFSWNFFGDHQANAVRAGSESLSPGQVKQVEGIVRSYLVAHPDVLIDVFRALKKQKTEAQRAKVKSVVQQHAEALFNAPTSPVLGNVKGDITLVEFLDYRCSHCKAMHRVVEALMKKNPKLRVVIKEYPIFSGASDYAARAALATQQHNKFAAMHSALLSEKEALTEKKIDKIAAALGIKKKTLARAMKKTAVQAELDGNVQLAKYLGLSGTPAFLLGDKKGAHSFFVPGATNLVTFQAALDKLRAVQKAKAAD